MASISVIIPAYNAADTLGRAIRSVLAQSLPADEIIVVDDGSTDSTREVAGQFGDAVRCVSQRQSGAAGARNAGARLVSGRLLAFLDADDEWHPRKLELQTKVLSEHPDLAFCSCLCQRDETTDVAFHADVPGNVAVRIISEFRDVFRNPYFGTPSIVMARDVFISSGGFDERLTLGEDLDLWLRAAYGRRVAVVEALLVRVYRTPGSLTLSSQENSYAENLKVVDRFCASHPAFLADNASLVREVRAMVLTNWGSETLIRGHRRRALGLLWRAMRRRPTYRAGYLIGKAAAGAVTQWRPSFLAWRTDGASTAPQPHPYFEQSNSAIRPARRLLLLSYNFPPTRAVGGLRWQKLARFAAERGWALDVIATDPARLAAIDPSALGDLPPGTRIFAVRERTLRRDRLENAVSRIVRFLPSMLAELRRPPPQDGASDANTPASATIARDDLHWLRSPRDLLRAYRAWMWTERERDWADRAYKLARVILNRAIHEGIVSCGPPHMPHIAGARLADEFGVPFVMDLRDSWSSCEKLFDSIASPLYLRLTERYERQAVARATLLICNTDVMRDVMRQKYPTKAHRIITVMNGYDDDPVPAGHATGRFVIAYAGVIYIDRDPSSLFEAAARVVRELGLTPSEFAIEFMGHVDSYNGISLAMLARRAGISEFVAIRSAGTRREAHEFLAEASMMVSLPQGLPSAIPSKVFEYMKFNAWLLALAERGSATERVLADTAADVAPPEDVERIASIIRTRVLQYRRGDRPPRLADREQRYSRKEQARLLFDAFEEVRTQRSVAQRLATVRAREPLQAAPPRNHGRPTAPLFLFSIDTEEDDWAPSRSEPRVENIRELPTLHSFLQQFGIRPTYFVTYQVATRAASVETIRELHASGVAEIAAHVHPWNTPPLTEAFEPRNSVLKNLPEALQYEKIQSLTRAFEDVLGSAPRAFRAGRWGLGASTVRALIRSGYEVDSSVTPYFNWEFMDDGANFVGSPIHAYRVSGASDVRVPEPTGALVEIPVSAGYSRAPFRLWHRVHSALTAPMPRQLRFPGIAARSGLVRKILLSPETNSAPQMVLLAKRLLDQGVAHLHLVCHSQSLSPGLGPFVRTRADLLRFYGDIEELMNALSAQTPLRFATVTEAAELLMPPVTTSAPLVLESPASVRV